MGLPLSLIFANLFMEGLEVQALMSSFLKPISRACFRDLLNTFQNHLNSVDIQ